MIRCIDGIVVGGYIKTDSGPVCIYDGKRKVKFDTLKVHTVVIDGNEYEICAFDTEPYESALEATSWQDALKMLDHVPVTLAEWQEYKRMGE